MAKKKEALEVVTTTIKNIHGDVVDHVTWRKVDGEWVSDRQGVMSDGDFQDHLKRMEKRDDVTITKDTIEL